MQPNKDYPYAISYLLDSVTVDVRANSDDFLTYDEVENIVADAENIDETVKFLLTDIEAVEVELIVTIDEGGTIVSLYGHKEFPLAPRPNQVIATASL